MSITINMRNVRDRMMSTREGRSKIEELNSTHPIFKEDELRVEIPVLDEIAARHLPVIRFAFIFITFIVTSIQNLYIMSFLDTADLLKPLPPYFSLLLTAVIGYFSYKKAGADLERIEKAGHLDTIKFHGNLSFLDRFISNFRLTVRAGWISLFLIGAYYAVVFSLASITSLLRYNLR